MPNVAFRPYGARVEELSAVVDGYPSLVHNLRGSVSSVPLERGARISDHYSPDPTRLTFTGWVSDLHIARDEFGDDPAFATSPARARQGTRARRAWSAFRRVNRQGLLLRVVTEWGIYSDMVMVKMEAPNDGEGIRFSMELRQAMIASPTRTTPIENLGPAAQARLPLVTRGYIGVSAASA